jgi:hypothetical protein
MNTMPAHVEEVKGIVLGGKGTWIQGEMETGLSRRQK